MQPETRQTLKKMGADILRFSVPESLAQGEGNYGLSLPETCIINLADWSEQGLDSDVRYKTRRARREGIQTRPIRVSDASFMYELYRLTVNRHEGRLRYTPRYFSAICNLLESSQDVYGLIAETPEQKPCGFIVTARADDTTYYLHGGFDPANANNRPGYVLMCAAIKLARDNGCVRFNLMSSPENQPTLVRFKEKWGGQTQPLFNLDIPISKFGQIAHLGLRVRQRLSCRRRD
jgi:lipid II:glycine glycyltransferase (peptidoglycan interpeptide bridge formation enzyme)